MNQTPTPHGLDQRMLDRLVEGLLPAEEYRQILAQLDQQPSGWRQVALAFLEAQALRLELTTLTAAPTTSSIPTANPPAPALATPPRRWSGLALLAQAAALLLAVGIGTWLPSLRPTQPLESTVANHAQEKPPLTSAQQPATIVPQKTATPPQPIGQMKLVVNRGTDLAPRECYLPIYEPSSGIDPQWVSHSTDLSPALLAEIRRTGSSVRSEHSYLPVTLSDGKQVVFPVGHYKIVPPSIQ